MRDKELIEEKQHVLVEATASYCQEHLNDEYACLCVKLVNKMARKRVVPFLSGRMEIWAAAVIYAVCQINFAFDKASDPHTTPDDICDYFGVKKSTVSGKAGHIRDMFKMGYWDKEFSTAEMSQRDPYRSLVMVDGMIVPRSSLPPDIQRLLED